MRLRAFVLTLAEADVLASDVWENDFLLTTATDSLATFAHYTPNPKILYATLENGTFVSSATLLASGMFEEFAALFADIDPRIALPVRLKTFMAKAEGKTALLEWETESELNSSHFEIERSETGRDWAAIDLVPAKNIPGEPARYIYTDQPITAKRVYYRLKMTDRDSTFAYSQIRSVAFGTESELVAYPNPVGSESNIQILLAEKGVKSVRIYDLAGKLLLKSGTAGAKVNVQELPVGKYILHIEMQDGSKTSRAFVKR